MSNLPIKDKIIKKRRLSIRIREDIDQILFTLLKITGINKTDFVEIAIIEHILRFDNELKYEGINFKKYFEVLKYEKLRNYTAKIRNTIMSRALFMNRVRYDILKLVNFGAHLEEIKNYIDERITESRLYPESELLEKELEDYLKYSTDINYEKVREMIKEKLSENKNGTKLKEMEDVGKKLYLGVDKDEK